MLTWISHALPGTRSPQHARTWFKACCRGTHHTGQQQWKHLSTGITCGLIAITTMVIMTMNEMIVMRMKKVCTAVKKA